MRKSRKNIERTNVAVYVILKNVDSAQNSNKAGFFKIAGYALGCCVLLAKLLAVWLKEFV